MDRNTTHRIGARLVFLVAGLACGTAHAQYCDLVFRPAVPDFDQKREAGSGFTGLPNMGRMYCVPTSCIDQQAYLANHGYPNAVNSSFQGPRDWQTANVNTITFYINQMGQYMDTDPVGGTDGTYLSDWMDYMTDRLPNDYFVSYGLAFSPDDSISSNYPETVANMLVMGALVNLSIGWFELRHGEVTYWERTGGHCVALDGTSNACGSQPVLLWRDPGSGDSTHLQSHFTNALSTMTYVTAYYSWKDDSSYHERSTWRLNAYNGGDSFGFVGGYKAIWPNFGIGIDTVTGKIKFHFPKTPAADGGSQTLHYDFSAAGVTGAPLSIDLSPDMTCAVVLAGTPGLFAPKKLLKINTVDGGITTVATLGTFASRVLFSPRGELFAVDFNQLKKINPDDGAIIAVDELLHSATSWVYDDANDRILVLSSDDRVITAYGPDLKLRANYALPTSLALGANSSIAMHPLTGKPWVVGGDSPSCFELTLGPTVTGASRSLSGATAPRHLQFSPKGEVMIVDGGILQEYTMDSPTAPRYHQTNKTGMSGQAFGGPVKMAKSRTSYNPATIHLYEDINIEPAIVPDCRADLNDDALVDFADYLEFLNRYNDGDLSVDFVEDGIVDFVDYLEFLNLYDAGC